MIEMDRRNFIRTSAVVALALGGTAALASCAPETASSTVLRVGSTTDMDALNPFTLFSTQAYDVMQLVYDRLMSMTSASANSPRTRCYRAYPPSIHGSVLRPGHTDAALRSARGRARSTSPTVFWCHSTSTSASGPPTRAVTPRMSAR